MVTYVCLSISLLQNMIAIVILGLALPSGGIPSAINAADVQKDYIDYYCKGYYRIYFIETCDKFKQIRDTQIAAAVSVLICS